VIVRFSGKLPSGIERPWYDPLTMEILWAPWRIGYIVGEKPQGCIFCEKPAEQHDAENFIVWRGRLCFVMLNRYPYNNGHLMVVPFAHIASLEDLDTETSQEMMSLTQQAIRILRRAMRPAAFNVGVNIGEAAGAGVAGHVHLHIVPRWDGDTNFMPVLSDTRVIAQSLESCYALLQPEFADSAVPA
jgi:ATP adenylyltransferase